MRLFGHTTALLVQTNTWICMSATFVFVPRSIGKGETSEEYVQTRSRQRDEIDVFKQVETL